MNPNHPTDLLPGFALGCLERPDVDKVRRHLHDCAICQAEVAGYQNVVEVLAYEPPHPGPKRSKPKVPPLRRPASNNASQWFAELSLAWPRLVPALLVVWLIAVVILAISSIALWQRSVQLETSSLQKPRIVEFQSLSAAPRAGAAMLIEKGARRGLLLARALPALNEKTQFQLWLVKNGQYTSGGVFTASAQGDGRLEVIATRPLSEFDSFAISIEPFGGSPWPTGSKVLRGTLDG